MQLAAVRRRRRGRRVWLMDLADSRACGAPATSPEKCCEFKEKASPDPRRRLSPEVQRNMRRSAQFHRCPLEVLRAFTRSGATSSASNAFFSPPPLGTLPSARRTRRCSALSGVAHWPRTSRSRAAPTAGPGPTAPPSVRRTRRRAHDRILFRQPGDHRVGRQYHEQPHDRGPAGRPHRHPGHRCAADRGDRRHIREAWRIRHAHECVHGFSRKRRQHRRPGRVEDLHHRRVDPSAHFRLWRADVRGRRRGRVLPERADHRYAFLDRG